MKKYFAILFFLLLSANIFAADFSISVGGGGLLGYTFTRYTLKGGDVKSTQEMDRFDFGGFIFADFTYAEFSVLYQVGRNSYKENLFININEGGSLSDATGIGQELSLGFSLMGKYPFKIDEVFTWFPLLGVEYQVALQQLRKPDGDLVYDRSKGRLVEDRNKNNNPYSLSAWNSWWINIGAGADFNCTERVYLRGEFIFGFRLPTTYEMGALDVVEKQTGVRNPKLSGLTGSPMIKFAAGYRF